MKLKIASALCLSLSLGLIQVSQAAAITKSANSKITLPAEKSSLIEKALTQHKNDLKAHADDNLKVLTSLKTAPSQSFFASQNQSFSRFVQALFSSSAS